VVIYVKQSGTLLNNDGYAVNFLRANNQLVERLA
jgi:hypothetical protein